MSDPNTFWFHCGRCGTLFRSPAGEVEERLCPKCGFDPVPGVQNAPAKTGEAGESETANATGARGRRTKRASKAVRNRHLTIKLIVGWTLGLVLLILLARRVWWVEPPVTKAPPPAAPAALPEEDPSELRDAGQTCAAVFSSFLASGTPEERNQFVLSPIATASKIARFYSLNPSTNLDPKTLEFTGNSFLRMPGAKALETQWKSSDGRQVDAVFRQENGEWRLDWDHFARYSDYPWSLFLAGSGDPEGQFRLLARERLAEERKDEDTMSIVLYAPRFGRPGDTGFQSPEFLVPRRSRDGRLLAAAFKLAAGGGRVYGSRLPEMNPDGMIRVRVKVRRTEVDMERKFEIAGVIACHWHSLDDPGVEPAPENGEVPVGN